MTNLAPLPAALHLGDTLPTMDLPVTLSADPTGATVSVEIERAVAAGALTMTGTASIAGPAGSGPWTGTLRYAWQPADTAMAAPGLYLVMFSVHYLGGDVETFPTVGALRLILSP